MTTIREYKRLARTNLMRDLEEHETAGGIMECVDCGERR